MHRRRRPRPAPTRNKTYGMTNTHPAERRGRRRQRRRAPAFLVFALSRAQERGKTCVCRGWVLFVREERARRMQGHANMHTQEGNARAAAGPRNVFVIFPPPPPTPLSVALPPPSWPSTGATHLTPLTRRARPRYPVHSLHVARLTLAGWLGNISLVQHLFSSFFFFISPS